MVQAFSIQTMMARVMRAQLSTYFSGRTKWKSSKGAVVLLNLAIVLFGPSSFASLRALPMPGTQVRQAEVLRLFDLRRMPQSQELGAGQQGLVDTHRDGGAQPAGEQCTC